MTAPLLGEIGSKCFGSRTEQGAIDKHRRIDIFAGLAVLLLLVDGESEGENARGIPLFAKLRIAREVAHDGHSVDSHCLSNLSMAFAEDSGILLPGKLSSLAVYKYSRLAHQQPIQPASYIYRTQSGIKAGSAKNPSRYPVSGSQATPVRQVLRARRQATRAPCPSTRNRCGLRHRSACSAFP